MYAAPWPTCGAIGAPYYLSNSYIGPEIEYRYGEPGSHWFTGAAGWLVTVLLNHIFGLRARPEGLEVNPCLPIHWRRCSVRRSFRGALYEVSFKQSGREACNRISRILVDGRDYGAAVLPLEKGRTYRVEVELSP